MFKALEKNSHLQLLKSLKVKQVKFKEPLILRMYGLLNDLNLRKENRYILCNFIDQNSTIFELNEDIYEKNKDCSLNQLFLYAITKAKENDLIKTLYDEYLSSINAISEKREFNPI
jgi:hypothetical protein